MNAPQPSPSAPLSRRAARLQATAASQAPAAHEAPVSQETLVDAVAEAQTLIAAAAVADANKTHDSARTASSFRPKADAPADADPFEQAARALGLAPVVEQPASADTDPKDETQAEPADAEVAVERSGRLRRLVTVGATVGVMGIAGLLTVSMSLPTGAVAVAQGTQAGTSMSLVTASSEAVSRPDAGDDEIQAFVAPSDVQNEAIERADDFSAVSLVDIAAEQGINYSSEVFTNDPDAAIQWPFMVGVGMTWGYGMRDGRMHNGIDFVPGNGAPIQAIADGVVRKATEQGGGYGVTVYIDHVIDGEVITSHYSHMQYGSMRVKTGDKVEVGDIVGLTGNTGRSYGAHLHFELIVNGSPIDPMPWLKENAGRDSLG